MNFRVITPLLCCLTLLFIYSCNPPTSAEDYEAIEITGQVVSNSSNQALENAIVRVIHPMDRTTVTDSEGFYNFDVEVDSTITLTITANKEGFTADTVEVLAIPERNIELPIFRLQGTGEESVGSTEGAGSISLVSIDPEYIVVQGSGGSEDAVFVFQVRDSSGNALSGNNPVTVSFDFGSHPDGGESLHPSSVQTDGEGRAAVNLRSGSKAGVVQIVAEVSHQDMLNSMGQETSSSSQQKKSSRESYILAENESAIRSKPVSITIHGGLPNQDHFALVPEVKNLPGYDVYGLTTSLTAFVGDKFGNIVAPGTSVYFTTDGGYIEGTAKTGDNGRAVAELTATSPMPVHESKGPGYATILAKTADENNATITAQAQVLFSGTAQVEIDQTPIGRTYSYTVSDQNGNPLSAGTSINVSIEGENVDLSGDIDITLEDEIDAGPDVTEFSFTVTGEGTGYEVTVTATGPNGTASDKVVREVEPVFPTEVNLTREFRNMPTGGFENTITANISGEMGRVVDPTEVRFSTTHGTISNVTTDENGQAVAILRSFNNLPPDGRVTVTAEVTDKDGSTLSDQTDILFSGEEISINIDPDVIDLDNMAFEQYNYTVTDQNNNPLAPGTEIKVTVETPDDSLSVIGDIDITLGDHQTPGQGKTEFIFHISDDDEEIKERPVQITIFVSGPNGIETKTISGSKMKTAP